MLSERLKKEGIDVAIYVSYFKKNECTYIIDAPVMYSELSKNGASRDEIARILCNRCNELGRINTTSIKEI